MRPHKALKIKEKMKKKNGAIFPPKSPDLFALEGGVR
jgi:hypothetical protein